MIYTLHDYLVTQLKDTNNGLVGAWVNDTKFAIQNIVDSSVGNIVGTNYSVNKDNPNQLGHSQDSSTTTSGDCVDTGSEKFGNVDFSTIGSQPFSVITVFKFNATGGTGCICAKASAASGASFYIRRQNSTTWPAIMLHGTDNGLGWWNNAAGVGDGIHTIGLTFDGSTANAYGDDDKETLGLSVGATALQSANFSFLARTPTSPGFTANAVNYVTLVFDRAIEKDFYLELEHNIYLPFDDFLNDQEEWAGSFYFDQQADASAFSYNPNRRRLRTAA